MKKVLILAYDFPPYVSVGGLRPYSWFKYLHEFDVYPIVITRQWSNSYGNLLDYIAPGASAQTVIEEFEIGTIIKTPYFPNLSNKLMLKYGDKKFKFLRKIISAYYEFAQYLFIVGPKSRLYYTAEEYLNKHKVDAIITTGDPFILFKYASLLSRRFNIPWIADYRDLWSQDISMQKNKIFKRWSSYFEKKIVPNADLITTVSDFTKVKISSLIINKKIKVLPNGYDPEAFESVKGIRQQNKVLAFAYAGKIWEWHPLESFLRVCADFIENTDNTIIQISFYGVNVGDKIRSLIKLKYQILDPFVKIFPKISNEKLLRKLAEENILISFNDYSLVGTKIYDYICVKRKILFCYSDDEAANELKKSFYTIDELESMNPCPQADLINETNSGIVVRNEEHLRSLLPELYREFKTNGFVACNPINFEKYSRKIQVKEFAKIIHNCSNAYVGKRILILAYDFPPYVSVGGLRPYNWYKYLHEFDVYPVIVTRQWSNKHGNYLDYIAPGDSPLTLFEESEQGTIIKTPYLPNLSNRLAIKFGDSKFRFLRKMISAYYEFIQYLVNVGPKSQLYFAANEYLKNNKVDYIVTTGDPFILFKYASVLSRKFNTPWIADYRDLWSQDISIQKNKLFKAWSAHFEKKVVRSSDLIITVSGFFKAKITGLIENKKIKILPNGFDPEVFESLNGIQQRRNIFSIAFAGTIYKWHPLASFLRVCSEFLKKTDNAVIQISFYGINVENEIRYLIKTKYQNLDQYVRIFRKTSNGILLQKLAEENILILFNDYSIVGTKIYDYLSVQRTILFCYADDKEANKLKKTYFNIDECDTLSHCPQSQIINETNSGIIVKNAEHLGSTLNEKYEEFRTNGFVACNPVNIEKYSRKIQVKEFADIIHDRPATEVKKRILILAYDFPPYVSVGGLRPYNWFKYLSGYDVYPVVITRQWSNKYGSQLDYIAPGESGNVVVEASDTGTIIRTPYEPNRANRLMLHYGESRFVLFRKLISAYFEFAQYLFNVGPKSRLYDAGIEYLKKNKVDAIIASGDPFILFKYASRLGKKFNIPWIADYRDLWSQTLPVKRNFILKNWTTYFERRIVSNAALIITVLDLFKLKISTLFENKKVIVIPNGYDPEVLDKIKDIQQQSQFMNIAFIGTIEKYHPVKIFMSVVSRFVKTNTDAKINVNFYGINAGNEILELLTSDFPELRQHVNIFPKMPNDLLMQHLAKENLMLLFNYYSNIGTKIYDYLAVNRSILFCFSEDCEADKLKEKYYHLEEESGLGHKLQEDLIRQTNAGYIVRDSEHLYNLLVNLYSEFSQKGYIPCNTINAERYSRKYQTGILAGIFRNINNIYKIASSGSIPRSAIDNKRYSHYQQCTRCVMDTSDPDIVFYEDGCCNHCHDYFEKISKLSYQGIETDIKLTQLIERVKHSGKGKDFDCVIGVSGGVDSIYAAFLAKKFGLRPLAVHMDNGWNSELAVSNIEKILNKLNIELHTFVLDWEEFRDLQLAFLKASVIEAETPTDIAILAALHKVAKKYKIKYIFSGGNYATEGILPKSWHYNAKDVKFLNAVQRQLGTKKIDSFPTFGYLKEMYYKLFRGIKMIYLLNYIPYNKTSAITVLEQELDWKNYGGKHHESIYTKFVQSYLLPEKFGIDYRHATLSTQICAGEITREEALEELKKPIYDRSIIEEEKLYVSKKFNISLDELNAIINTPPKSFRDYPNDQKKLEFIYKLYRKFNR